MRGGVGTVIDGGNVGVRVPLTRNLLPFRRLALSETKPNNRMKNQHVGP